MKISKYLNSKFENKISIGLAIQKYLEHNRNFSQKPAIFINIIS